MMNISSAIIRRRAARKSENPEIVMEGVELKA